MRQFSILRGLSAFMILCIFFTSCVQEEYDTGNLNNEITVGPGMVIPLAKTEQLKLKDLLSKSEIEQLTTDTNGVYTFHISDEMNFDEELDKINNLVKINDVSFNDKVTFSFKGTDFSDIRIDARNYVTEYSMGDVNISPDIDIPTISYSYKGKTGIWEYKPSGDAMALSVPSITLVPDDALYVIPESIVDNLSGEIPIPSYIIPDKEFNVDDQSISIETELPEGISDIKDIKISNKAKIQIEVGLTGSFLHTGEVTPDVEIDLSDFANLKGHGGKINIAQDLTISKSNGWKASKSYEIESLNIKDSDCQGNIIKLNKSVSVNGHIRLSNAVTTGELLKSSREMGVELKVSFADIALESFTFSVDPVEISTNENVEFTINDIELPESIKAVPTVEFTDASSVNIAVKKKNFPSADDFKVSLTDLEVTFPDCIKLRGTNGNKVVFNNVDLSKDFRTDIAVKSIEFPDPVNGMLSLEESVSIKATASAAGRLSTKDLPTSEADDYSIEVDVTSDIELADYVVETYDIYQDLNTEPENISIEIPAEMADMGSIDVYAKGSPAIEILMEYPENLNLSAGQDGLSITFPEMICFKDVDPSYNFNPAANSITFTNDIPKKISLKIDHMTIAPVKNEDDGKYYCGGTMDVDGSLRINGASYHKADIDNILNSSIRMSVNVPEMQLESVDIDSFSTRISESFAFDMLKPEDLPKEVVEISRIDFENVFIDMSIAVSNLPDLGDGNCSYDFTINLPDFIILGKDQRIDEKGNIAIKGKLVGNTLKIDPVKVEAIELSGYDISNGIKGEIKVNGSVSLNDTRFNINDLTDREMSLDVNAAIKDISITRISGKVDYRIESLKEEFDLREITEVLGEETVLDLADIHLILDIATNVGFNVSGNIKFTPYKDGIAMNDKAVSLVLVLPHSQNASTTIRERYWVGSSKDACPADCIFIEGDLSGLIATMPDKIVLSLDAITDSSAECIVEPLADYTLELGYKLEAPLAFGKDMAISFSTDMEEIELPDIITDVINTSDNVIVLKGQIASTIPLQLEMTANLVDESGKIIQMEKPTTQVIKCCGTDGSETVSELNIHLQKKENTDKIGKITKITLDFKASSGNSVNVPVTENCYIQADLKLSLPNGLTTEIE